jgi:hypothetical protein
MGKEPLKQQRLHCLAGVSDEGNVEVAVTALAAAVQFQAAFDLSVFVASVNGWNNCYFKQVFSSNDG